jgi:inositol phosphorylceramide mannosyltransferase catalytic subunit
VKKDECMKIRSKIIKRITTFLIMYNFGDMYSEKSPSFTPITPHFDLSLGSRDAYFNHFYFTKHQKLLQDPCLTIARTLYEKHIALLKTAGKANKIPLIIHQIWLGSPLPNKYKEWQETWKSLAGWEYKLWTDESVKELHLVNREIFEASKNYGQKADILRMELLDQFGGVYVDMDFECLNPDFFLLLHKCYHFYTGIHPLDTRNFGLNNALIGSIKGHPIVKGYIRELKDHCIQPACGKKSNIVSHTGPGFFTKMFMKYTNSNYKDIAFPSSYFYPLGLQQFKLLRHLTKDQLLRHICKPESAAIHWWDGSWQKPSATVKE